MAFDKKSLSDDELARSPTHAAGEVQDLEKYTTKDAVFGEITEGGPNYRNVRFFTGLTMLRFMILTSNQGRLGGYRYSDDEDANWVGCSLDTSCV